jgi:hypothetical protein
MAERDEQSEKNIIPRAFQAGNQSQYESMIFGGKARAQ